MNQLENVTRDEFGHLTENRMRIFNEIRSISPGFGRAIFQYDLRYDPETKKVALFKARRSDTVAAAVPKTTDLIPVDSPDAVEQKILEVAQQYLEQFRTARTYTT